MYEPLYRHRPSHRWTNGDLAAKVGADLGLPPDDEQRWILDSIFAEVAPDRPAAFEVAAVAPRQNIKTSTFGIAALADFFVFGIKRHVWSSHLLDTSGRTFADFRTWIRSNPDYEDQVTFYEGHQDLKITRRDDPDTYIDFVSRTGKKGRGYTGVQRITLDEWLYGEASHVGAIYPTMLTRPGAQIRLMSSAGLVTSEQLRALRDRGRSRKDKRLSYVEYGAPVTRCTDPGCLHIQPGIDGWVEGCALDDRALWWAANCALWQGRVGEEPLSDLRNSMPPAEFMREFLSWWEDPEALGGAFSYPAWVALQDPTAERGEHPVFGLDVAQDRSGWIAVAWRRSDGAAQVMLANDGRPVAAPVVASECARVAREWLGQVYSPKSFEGDLRDAGAQAEAVSSSDFTTACGQLEDAINAAAVRHGNQPVLNTAVRAAKWRPAGVDGSKTLQLKDMPEVGPLAAVVRALHGLSAQADYDPLDSIC